MAVPSVTVSLTDETFVKKQGENAVDFLCGIIVDSTDLIHAVGTTGEVTNNFVEVAGLDDWWARLSLTDPNGSGVSFDGLSGGSGRWPSGPTGTWKNDWWKVETYLEYGGKAVVGVSSGSPFTSKNSHNLNAVFGVTTGLSADISDVLTNRSNDCVALYHIEDKTTSSVPSGANGNKIYVYGIALTIEEKDLVISEAKEILDVEDVIASIILVEDLRIQRE